MQDRQAAMNIYDLRLWKRFRAITVMYWHSEEKWRARGVLAMLVLLMVGSTLIGRQAAVYTGDLTTALSKMDTQAFNRLLLMLFGVYLVLVPTDVYQTYIQRKLNINWRTWLTTHFLNKYFADRAYYHISNDKEIDNPDQRISDNVAYFTETTLGYISVIFGSVLKFCSYAGILWGISPKLMLVLILYATAGTIVTIILGKPLLGQNFLVQQLGADFRYGAVHIRDNAESIAFYRGEGREKDRLAQRLREYIGSQITRIRWERNLGFFTQLYSIVPSLLSTLIIVPDYFSGKIELGALGLAGMSFSFVLNSLSVFVSSFTGLSSFAATVTRVETFDSALDKNIADHESPGSNVIRSHEDNRLALDNVTLQTPDYRRTLAGKLSAELSQGKGLLIAGASGAGKSSLLRAIAGIWNAGSGEITRPPLREMMFLPQKPYMIQGTLRDQLLYPDLNMSVTDEDLTAVLARVNLTDLATRFNGFEVVKDWDNMLSLGEQQRLAFARLLLTNPRYAMLDEATSALDVANEAGLYSQIKESGMTYLSVGHRPSLLAFHDKVLELQGGGAWQIVPADGFRLTAADFK